MLFEELGFKYIGPVDGHDLDLMIDLFTAIKQIEGPVFVHLRTVKGKGYDPAEGDARKWHAVTPPMFKDTAAGTASGSKSSGQTWTNVFSKAIMDMAAQRPESSRHHRRHAGRNRSDQVQPGAIPDRYFDTAIAEQHAVGFAAGLAAEGMKPITAIYSTFLQRAYDMVLHDVGAPELAGDLLHGSRWTRRRRRPHASRRVRHRVPAPYPQRGSARAQRRQEMDLMLRYMVQEHVVGPNAGPIAIRYPRGNAPSIEWPRQEAGRGQKHPTLPI